LRDEKQKDGTTMKNKIANHFFQQGDVLGRRLDTMPEGEQKTISKLRCVVAHGEGGHSHVIEDSEAELIQIGERMLLKLEKAASVQHEEHGTITLSPGIWEIGTVKEYDYFQQMVRRVVD
jgi:hypothetical protein